MSTGQLILWATVTAVSSLAGVGFIVGYFSREIVEKLKERKNA